MSKKKHQIKQEEDDPSDYVPPLRPIKTEKVDQEEEEKYGEGYNNNNFEAHYPTLDDLLLPKYYKHLYDRPRIKKEGIDEYKQGYEYIHEPKLEEEEEEDENVEYQQEHQKPPPERHPAKRHAIMTNKQIKRSIKWDNAHQCPTKQEIVKIISEDPSVIMYDKMGRIYGFLDHTHSRSPLVINIKQSVEFDPENYIILWVLLPYLKNGLFVDTAQQYKIPVTTILAGEDMVFPQEMETITLYNLLSNHKVTRVTTGWFPERITAKRRTAVLVCVKSTDNRSS